jgi:tRNA G10  N-methylase Trm11
LRQPSELTPSRRDEYIPPKRPYGFEAMLDDILQFGAEMLVPNGRLSLWMPSANEEDVELGIPTHEALELMSVCVQPFNKCESNVTRAGPPGASTSKETTLTGPSRVKASFDVQEAPWHCRRYSDPVR